MSSIWIIKKHLLRVGWGRPDFKRSFHGGKKRLILEAEKKRQVPLRRMERGVGGSLAGYPDSFRLAFWSYYLPSHPQVKRDWIRAPSTCR